MNIIKERKATLKASVENHKKALNNDLILFANKTEKVVENIIITLCFSLSIVVLHKLSRNKKKPKRSNRLLKVAKQQLAIYLLNKCRSKIVDYIHSIEETKP